MKIVITGALGHVGSKIIRELPNTFPDLEIVMIDNLTTQRYCSLFNLPADGTYRFIEGDVADIDLEPFLENADVCLHLAAITDAAGSFADKDNVERNNFNTTKRVAECCGKLGCPMIHLSSTSVYGTQNDVVDENCSAEELQPQSPYAETKLKEENFLHTMASSGELRFTICRFGTICGVSPGMRFHTAVNKFSWQAVFGKPITVWRTALHQQRPYLVLDDAVRAISFIIKNNLFDQSIYNVLTENLSVNSIIESIRESVPKLTIKYVDTEIMNQLSYDVSNARFRNQGFEFTGDVGTAIGETIELLKKSGVKLTG